MSEHLTEQNVPENIEVRIDELVVEGLRQPEAVQFGRAVERELSRLIRQNGLPGGQIRNRPVIEVEHEPHPRQRHPDAAAVAAAIFRAVIQ